MADPQALDPATVNADTVDTTTPDTTTQMVGAINYLPNAMAAMSGLSGGAEYSPYAQALQSQSLQQRNPQLFQQLLTTRDQVLQKSLSDLLPGKMDGVNDAVTNATAGLALLFGGRAPGAAQTALGFIQNSHKQKLDEETQSAASINALSKLSTLLMDPNASKQLLAIGKQASLEQTQKAKGMLTAEQTQAKLGQFDQRTQILNQHMQDQEKNFASLDDYRNGQLDNASERNSNTWQLGQMAHQDRQTLMAIQQRRSDLAQELQGKIADQQHLDRMATLDQAANIAGANLQMHTNDFNANLLQRGHQTYTDKAGNQHYSIADLSDGKGAPLDIQMAAPPSSKDLSAAEPQDLLREAMRSSQAQIPINSNPLPDSGTGVNQGNSTATMRGMGKQAGNSLTEQYGTGASGAVNYFKATYAQAPKEAQLAAKNRFIHSWGFDPMGTIPKGI